MSESAPVGAADGRAGSRRVANRKAQLTDLAAELFRRHGYHQVGVQEIGAAAGLTGPAVYRHFRSKREILAQVLLAGVDAFGSAVDAALAAAPGPAAPAGPPQARLGALTAALARLSVERRDTTALWRWQRWHLEPADQAAVVQRAGAVMDRWVGELRLARRELDPADAELLCWAAMSVFGSVAVHHTSPPRDRFAPMLAQMADAVLASTVVPARPDEAAAAAGAGADDPAGAPSRREAVLAGATRLFRQRGYHAVSMEDIGAEVGIAGPSVYRHFASKADLLYAACIRMADRLLAEAGLALAAACGPVDALDRLVRSYAGAALAHRDLLSVYAADAPSLPEQRRNELVRVQRAYVQRWVDAARAASPGLLEAEARTAVHAGLTIVNDLVRTHRLASRPRLATELAGLVAAALAGGGVPGPADSVPPPARFRAANRAPSAEPVPSTVPGEPA